MSNVMIVVLMGVSGSGKTTIGKLLAERAPAIFADADDYHSQANKDKMSSGHPLDDADRQPWLETLNGILKGWFSDKKSGVLACSALKQSYRATLAAGLPDGVPAFCLLEVSPEILAKRMAERTHSFMNPNLLASQLATLEAPSDAIVVQNDREPDQVVDEILKRLMPEKR